VGAATSGENRVRAMEGGTAVAERTVAVGKDALGGGEKRT